LILEQPYRTAAILTSVMVPNCISTLIALF
jgi:hypothetical protein